MKTLNNFFSIRLIYFFAVVLFFYSTSLYSSPNTTIRIHSNSLKYNGKLNNSTFTGNVVAVSDNYTLTTDEALVYFTSSNEVTKLECEGNVNFKSQDILAVANRAVLENDSKMIYLYGSVKIWQKENYLEGDEVQIQYEDREIFVTGSKDKVTVIFTTGDEVIK